MGYFLNTTHDYHTRTLSSLGWEMTVCNALYPENSLCRTVLKNNASFGAHLFHFLERFMPLAKLKTVLEVGGGMGYLMRDFLSLAPHFQASMLDISPLLLQKQKETLAKLPVSFYEADFLNMSASDLRHFELVILNENLGDFPTLVSDHSHTHHNEPETKRWLNKIDDFEEEFSFNFDSSENINIGALTITEKLCGARVPYIYLSEHSCESSHHNPSYPRLNFKPSGNPERISLKGHDEFTIKFSHLQKIAQAFHYKVVRGQYIDFLYIDFNDKVQAALRSATPLSDQQEIIRQFVYDLYKYEYMVLIDDKKKKG